VKLSVLAAGLVFAGAACGADLKVMSFNIRYGTAKDGEDHWDKRKAFLVETVQKFILDQYLIVPVCRNVAIWGFGPRLANNPLETVVGSVPQYNYLGLYEDLQIKD